MFRSLVVGANLKRCPSLPTSHFKTVHSFAFVRHTLYFSVAIEYKLTLGEKDGREGGGGRRRGGGGERERERERERECVCVSNI